jgi:hypothetical protein
MGAPISTKTITGESVCKSSLTPLSLILIRDQIISKCPDKIIPLPQSIRVNPVPNHLGGCVCVLEIDESECSPHQTNGTWHESLGPWIFVYCLEAPQEEIKVDDKKKHERDDNHFYCN